MTRSTNMERVEVLRELRRFAVGKEIGALDAAIASLSAPQPPAEAQAQGGGEVFGWVLGDAFVDARFWTADTPPQGWTPVYLAPPSAPVGVKIPPRKNERDSDGKFRTIYLFDTPHEQGQFQRHVEVLTQQPAAPTWIGIDWAAGQQPAAVLYRCTECDDHYRVGTPCDCKVQPGHPSHAPEGQQPAAVDGAMVERAVAGYAAGPWAAFSPEASREAHRERMRAALTAALELQQGGRSDD